MLRRIILGSLSLPPRKGAPPADISCAEVLHEVLFAGGPQGLPTRDLKASFDVWQIIKAAEAKPSVLISDAHHKHLLRRLDAFVWGTGHEDMARFVLAIEQAPSVDPNEEPA